MIGAVVFVIFFVVFTLVSLVIDLPPGMWVHDWFDLPASEYSSLINGVVNGVVYGVIIWLVFSLTQIGKKKEPAKAAKKEAPEKAKVTEEEALERASKAKEEALKTLAEKEERRGLNEIEGIGSTYAKKLAAVGVKTTEELLETGATKRGRETLAKKTGISEKLVLEWVNLADLFRVKGVGGEYSDLLEEAGVDTVVELSRRNPENLHAKILEVNEKKKLVRRPPTLDKVRDWVEQAKKLPRKVEY